MNRVTAIIGVVALGGGLIVTSSQHAAAFDPVPSTVPGAAAPAPLATETAPRLPVVPAQGPYVIVAAAQPPVLVISGPLPPPPPVLAFSMPMPPDPDLELTLDLPRRTAGEDLDVALDTLFPLNSQLQGPHLLSGQCYVPLIDPPPTAVPAADDAIFDRVATQGT